ncbi:hypothetical protein ACX93W_25385 [Paenibacillus sp. CAU 1782]
MLWYTMHKPKLAEIYETAKRHISDFPAPLDSYGLRYAELFNPVAHEEGRDYICTLLPFWLKEDTSITETQCAELALANIYGMLYYFIQDDLMDGKVAEEGQKEQFALGNLLYLGMLRCFRRLFHSESMFWDFHDKYAEQWADSVVNEARDNYFVTDIIRTSGKAAPLKITVVGACLLGGCPERISALEQAVDLALTTLQMLDDWNDWREDLHDGNYNGLLALIASRHPLSSETARARETSAVWHPPTLKEAETAIYIKDCMSAFADYGERNHALLLGIKRPPCELISFHLYMCDTLRAVAKDLWSRKQIALSGGINRLYALNKGPEQP